MMDLYCKIFVNAKSKYSEIFEKILKHVSGKKSGFSDIESDWCSIRVKQNEEYFPNSVDFLYWKYYLDIEPSIDEEIYIQNLKELMKFLKENFANAVPACDFESELGE
ncbi:MAG: 1,4-dihydroxy-6-naphthoate synthase [Oscillospiraceae bacterium]|nr:1,4-dihydroxy-6-naphthoate synthase [Oscillospiraceae bacterium]